jgi:hypothetical protein
MVATAYNLSTLYPTVICGIAIIATSNPEQISALIKYSTSNFSFKKSGFLKYSSGNSTSLYLRIDVMTPMPMTVNVIHVNKNSIL